MFDLVCISDTDLIRSDLGSLGFYCVCMYTYTTTIQFESNRSCSFIWCSKRFIVILAALFWTFCACALLYRCHFVSNYCVYTLYHSTCHVQHMYTWKRWSHLLKTAFFSKNSHFSKKKVWTAPTLAQTDFALKIVHWNHCSKIRLNVIAISSENFVWRDDENDSLHGTSPSFPSNHSLPHEWAVLAQTVYEWSLHKLSFDVTLNLICCLPLSGKGIV